MEILTWCRYSFRTTAYVVRNITYNLHTFHESIDDWTGKRLAHTWQAKVTHRVLVQIFHLLDQLHFALCTPIEQTTVTR